MTAGNCAGKQEPPGEMEYRPKNAFGDINFYQSEENLRAAMEGTDQKCAQKLPQGDSAGFKYQIESDEEGGEENQYLAIEQLKKLNESPELEFPKQATPYFFLLYQSFDPKG